ncbi:MAG TPA: efflux RND transporter permease subunit [Chloroflexota bacterium]|nr:efflux RND transporter permease subunit [Chloroflexota bacterium]
MNPIVFALRHPITMMTAIVAVIAGAVLAVFRMPIDIFPDLNTPIIYVAQPFGGMDPQQMEGFLTNYYEYHFLYITGIEHVESKNIQGVALMKLFFHPGTNMAGAMAETVSYVNRARSFMPPNTVPPFIMRFDAGSVPVGYLVFKSETKSIGQIQDEALFRVRPMFASLPGVSAPPPFGGNQRTIVLRADPERLKAYKMSPDEVVAAIASGNEITPSGNVTINGKSPIVPVNSVVGAQIRDLEKIPIRLGTDPTVYVGDIGYVVDATDVPTGYGLVDGKRSVYILVTKRADASTLAVVNAVKANLPRMQAAIPEDIKVSFEFDQSPYVTRAIWGVGMEGLLGAALTGLMVLLFLRDWRSVIVVVLNIPFALLGATVALALTGQTINLMTLGGLALAVGILVDEATVEVENIHTQFEHTPNIARAVRQGNAQTAVPRLLAMLCVLAVFIPSFFMQGAAKALFVPLSLAVGFSMIVSYLLSSTFVPVMSSWLLRHVRAEAKQSSSLFSMARLQNGYAWLLHGCLRIRWVLLVLYLGVPILLVGWWWVGHPGLGTEIFPKVDSGQFELRVRAPDGSALENTEALTKDVLDEIARQAGGDQNVDISVSLVGTASYNYPINAIYLWTAGSQEAVLRVALKRQSGIRLEEFKNRLRTELPKIHRRQGASMKGVELQFESGDIVEQVMSFGSPTPVQVTINGPKQEDNRAYAEKLRQQLAQIPSLRDLQYEQSLDYPTIDVNVDRALAGLSGVTARDVGRSLAPATLSSRFTTPLFWRDPKSGIGYQVQVEIPQSRMDSISQIEQVPIKATARGDILLQDVAQVRPGSMPGQVDRYNMRRMVSLTANVEGEDLGNVAQRVDAALKAAGDPPRGALVEVRGQVFPMRQMFGALAGGRVFEGLTGGLIMAVAFILLLLTAYFQSIRLALVIISTTPAVLAGVILALLATRTTLNIQSFMGAIMAVGVAVANAILLATFAEQNRREGRDAGDAAVEGAKHRLRPILMTSCAMIAGMVPMAAGFGEGGEQTAPLGRAVIGGLAIATFATLFILPSIFAVVQGRSSTGSASLDPDDPESPNFDHGGKKPVDRGRTAQEAPLAANSPEIQPS